MIADYINCGLRICRFRILIPHSAFPACRQARRIPQLQHSELRNGKGFTLLELTISITLIGIIVLIITGAMRLGFRSVDSGERKIESLERMRASFNIIDCQIQSQVPLTYDDNGERKYYFKGDRVSMQFATNYSIWGAGGYVLASYRVVSDADGKQILYASENIIGFANGVETKLLDAFNQIYFEYFYKEPTEEEGSWVEQWTEDTAIPEKVRFHFIDRTRDLSFIVPLRVKSSPSPMTPQGGTANRPSPPDEE